MGSVSLAALIQSIAPAQGGITGAGFFEVQLLGGTLGFLGVREVR